MSRVIEQGLPGIEFDAQRHSLSSFFRRIGVNDFESDLLDPRIDQLYTWFFLEGHTGYCLKFMAEECLKKIRLGGQNGRRRRCVQAAAIFASRVHAWLVHEEDYFLSHRLHIANHAYSWIEMIQKWSSVRYPVHHQLAGELKPRLELALQKFHTIPLVVLKFDSGVPKQKTLF